MYCMIAKPNKTGINCNHNFKGMYLPLNGCFDRNLKSTIDHPL